MKPVLITTKYRGVFFGYLDCEPEKLPKEITLKNARNCIYWSSDCKGFIGLISNGPTRSCRIGPRADEITLWDVTSLAPCTSEATERWERAPWK